MTTKTIPLPMRAALARLVAAGVACQALVALSAAVSPRYLWILKNSSVRKTAAAMASGTVAWP